MELETLSGKALISLVRCIDSKAVFPVSQFFSTNQQFVGTRVFEAAETKVRVGSGSSEEFSVKLDAH